jgi:hypothetical protein
MLPTTSRTREFTLPRKPLLKSSMTITSSPRSTSALTQTIDSQERRNVLARMAQELCVIVSADDRARLVGSLKIATGR